MHLFTCVLFFTVFVCFAVAKRETTIPEEENHRCTGRHEVYTKCGSACPETCTSILRPDRACIALCVPGCFCKQGYVRNRWNTCIPQEKCQCKKNYETFRCGTPCQATCATLGQTCGTENEKCVDKCYCIDGFARDEEGNCVPVDQCPKFMVLKLKSQSNTPIPYQKLIN